MSYIIQEPSNFINIKLTDTGRRLLSLGALTFDKIVFSDREIDYSMGRGLYNLCNNRIMSPKDDQPNLTYSISSANNDLVTMPINGQNLTSARQIVSAMTNTVGFFTGSSNNWSIKTGSTIGDGNCLGFAEIDYSAFVPSGGTEINVVAGGYTASTGDLVYIPWEPPQYSGITNNSNLIYSGRPNVSLWYRVQGVSGNTLSLDRNTPNFSGASTTQVIQSYFYPFGDVEDFYGSATTVNCGIWNMNIVRTTSEIGTTSLMSGYTTYGSIEYNGTKHYLGLDNETKAFGIIHYTNKYSGNTYAEQLVPGTVKLEIPNIMWHNSFTTTLGEELNYGITLYDSYGDNIFDTVAQTYYRNIRDGETSASTIVGRVYHKLKTLIITDQELLTVLTYKSNRNYTLPNLNLNLASSTIGSITGFCKSDYAYYVTYVTYSDSYENGVSYGYPQSLPCGYISVIQGATNSNTSLPSVLRATFPSFSFPYLRNETNLGSLSGTGWNANSVQILLQEVLLSEENTPVGEIPTTGWKLISGNGIYTGATGTNTISPSDLQSHVFLLSQDDYDNATNYSLDGQFSAFTSNIDWVNESGLNFGNETFFYGNLTTGIQANVFKTVITVYAKNNEYNSSESNTTFDEVYDKNVYITEIGILNANDELVAVAKPAYPIVKNESRYFAFQLELDF